MTKICSAFCGTGKTYVCENTNIKSIEFLEPKNMKLLGFDLIKSNGNYRVYINDGTKHNNPDYNSQFPEPKGKVYIYVNFEYGEFPAIGIRQDGDTRNVYNGICKNQSFLKQLITSVR